MPAMLTNKYTEEEKTDLFLGTFSLVNEHKKRWMRVIHSLDNILKDDDDAVIISELLMQLR